MSTSNNAQATGNSPIPPGGPRAQPHIEPTFQFVALSDTHQFTTKVADHIREINQLDPDFVVHLGDFTADSEQHWQQLEPMLDAFEPALFMVPGNHDIFDEPTRRLYEQRYGRTYYGFDHKGVHFIALDSEIPLENGTISLRIHGEQLAWLRHDLEQHDDTPLKFIFVHQPLWTSIGSDVDNHAMWMRDVHPLLAKHRVSAVFAGHLHKYIESPTVDGVRYYVTFAVGGKLFDPDECHGNFHHCSVVTVRGGRWKLAVLRPGAIEPSDCVQFANPDSVRVLHAIRAAPTAIDRQTWRMPIKIDINNPSGQRVDYSAEPIGANCPQWHFESLNSGVCVEGGQTATQSFTATLTDPNTPYPGPKFRVNINGPEDRPLARTVVVPFCANLQCHCTRTGTAAVIDGRLDDETWSRCETIGPMHTFDGQGTPAIPTEVRLAWDDRHLYLGVRCPEPDLAQLVCNVTESGGHTWFDDSMEFFLPAGPDDWHHFIWNANAILYYEFNLEPRDPPDLCVAQSGRERDAWTLEAAIDWQALGIIPPQEGALMGFQVVRNHIAGQAERSMWIPTFNANFCPKLFGAIRFI